MLRRTLRLAQKCFILWNIVSLLTFYQESSKLLKRFRFRHPAVTSDYLSVSSEVFGLNQKTSLPPTSSCFLHSVS